MHIPARIALCLSLLCVVAQGAIVSFTVEPERTRTTLDQPIRIVATLVCDKDPGAVATPSVAPTEQYSVLRADRQQSSSSTISIMNGRTERKTEINTVFTYVIAPKQLGSFAFPQLSVTVDGQTVTGNGFTVEVLKEPVQSADVIVRLRAGKTRLYVGEQTTLTIVVGQKPGTPAQISTEGLQGLVGAVNESAKSSLSMVNLTGGRLSQSEEIVDGERYVVYKIQYAVIPLISGEVSLGSAPMQYARLQRAQRRGRDPFDDFFGGSFFGGGVEATPATAMSNTLRFTVSALPTPPADFCGSVGSASMNAEITPQQVPAGESVTLKIAVRASTRPGSLNDIIVPAVAGIEVFTPEKQTVADTTENGISSRRTYKYLLIPRTEGNVEIPAITMSFFDPQAGSYRTVSAGPFAILVGKGTQSGQVRRYMTQEEIKEVGQDIRYIKTPERIGAQSVYPHRSPLLYVINVFAILFALFALLYRIQSEQRARDPTIVLRRTAYRALRRELDTIGRAQGTSSETLGRVSSALDTYITNRFGFASTGMTSDELRVALAEHGADETTVQGLCELFGQIDATRFGGSGVAASNGILPAALALAEKLESAAQRSQR